MTRILLSFIFVGSFCLSSVRAQDNTPKYSNEFLTLGVGARGLAMGNAQTAISMDAAAGYWNPAGLLRMKGEQQLMLMHNAYFGGIANYDFGSFGYRMSDSSAIAVSLIRFSVDDIPDTRFLFDANGAINYNNIQFFSASDYAAYFSYARRLRFLNGVDFGASMKVIHRLVGSFSKAWGFGLDVGFQKQVGSWQFGLSGRDVFGTFNTWSHSPEEFRAVYQATGNDVPINTTEITLPRWIVGAAFGQALGESFNFLLTADLQATFDGQRNTLVASRLLSLDPMGGLEAGFREIIFLRYGLGQFQRIENIDGGNPLYVQMSGGLGIKLRELTIDYTLTDVGDIAQGTFSHVFTLTVDFDGKEAK
ncbi:MAG: hypothetical protein ACJAZM_002309 [Cyclobacteriaceae bacterium]|jgi:hypothetical protein